MKFGKKAKREEAEPTMDDVTAAHEPLDLAYKPPVIEMLAGQDYELEVVGSAKGTPYPSRCTIVVKPTQQGPELVISGASLVTVK